MSAGSPPLVVEGVGVRFAGLWALQGISLRVEQSAIAGLIGPNGAGKTTLFNAVAGLVPPASGRVMLFGDDVTSWQPRRRARHGLGRTFQRLELFGSMTVEENVVVAYEARRRRGGLLSDMLALPASVETRADALDRTREILARVGLSDYATQRSGDLPIGLSRTVELARALASEPRLLLLDEPSSGLSPEESRRLAVLLRSWRDEQGGAILVVEHDMPFVLGLCDYVYALEFGRSLAEGTPAQIRRNAAVRAAYLGEEFVDGSAAGG